jgi:hypothetical protein
MRMGLSVVVSRTQQYCAREIKMQVQKVSA